jgi:hypothetical protein
VHRNYLSDAFLLLDSSNDHPMLLKWVMMKRQQHHRMCINRMSSIE